MDMAAQILVIILSVVLSIFLIVGIILAIYLISLTKEIRKVTESAGSIVDGVRTAVERVTRITSPGFIVDIAERFFKKVKKNKREE